MTLTEFVTARLDEDEAAARAAHVETTLPAVWAALFEVSGHSGASVRAATDHIARHDPARVLAQVAAMRAIVDRYERALKRDRSNTGDLAAAGRTLALHGVMKYLAAIWRDHAQYDPAWAPEGE